MMPSFFNKAARRSQRLRPLAPIVSGSTLSEPSVLLKASKRSRKPSGKLTSSIDLTPSKNFLMRDSRSRPCVRPIFPRRSAGFWRFSTVLASWRDLRSSSCLRFSISHSCSFALKAESSCGASGIRWSCPSIWLTSPRTILASTASLFRSSTKLTIGVRRLLMYPSALITSAAGIFPLRYVSMARLSFSIPNSSVSTKSSSRASRLRKSSSVRPISITLSKAISSNSSASSKTLV
mmetsp:Transcript_3523/g.7026  ORF Transcript_3523/g.7026 Transcript_3523/m.7026 type:complete len:235 (-) Transcript_3523:236-940(-)